MGGGAQKETLLIVLPLPEDTSITDKIREKFPYIDVKYHQLTRRNLSFEPDQGLPKGGSVNDSLSPICFFTVLYMFPSCFIQ